MGGPGVVVMQSLLRFRVPSQAPFWYLRSHSGSGERDGVRSSQSLPDRATASPSERPDPRYLFLLGPDFLSSLPSQLLGAQLQGESTSRGQCPFSSGFLTWWLSPAPASPRLQTSSESMRLGKSLRNLYKGSYQCSLSISVFATMGPEEFSCTSKLGHL